MVNYEFYKSKYHGSSVSEREWPAFEARAAAQLNRYKRDCTVTAPENEPDAESMAVCAMADALAYFAAVQNGAGGPVASASIGSVSVSYAGASGGAVDLSARGQAQELYRCAALYLDICRGVGGCGC